MHPQNSLDLPMAFLGYLRMRYPKVERKRPSFQLPSHHTSTAHAKHRNFSTPTCGSDDMGSIPETEASFTTPINTTAPPETGTCKPISTYSPLPPPPSPAYTEARSQPPPPTTLQEPLSRPITPSPRHNIYRITEKLTENWIAEQGFGFVWTEPVRWLSKWWAEEF
ncbi:hypothetical protein SNOG_11960 [Parastagonospora nodorum SN15]|uniref:Uncharacterized protein n=1 Tax=Phaeosphaeria nodorum (strain SN15 / ATCC MYA-4574 / FGSC 10173) TaxID=321614 RepID=Q0U8F4_PHANO|nr:hypothetical protein SNOG_11960 [Parastagonospora nodorum SN15]EAT80372.1 hypothetical protein SNOG_11960 [Parastagonospora nodorum SN15]